MALENVLIYNIVTGDNTYPHTGSFTFVIDGKVTIDDSDGSGDTLFGDNTDGDAADVPDQNVTASTVANITVGMIIDSRYYYEVTGSDGSSGRIYFIATNQTNNYGDQFAANFQLSPGVTYTFGAFNRQGAVPYDQLVPCFARGTCLETDSGPVAVEDLSVGDLVNTMDAGLQAIRWIGSKALDAIDLTLKPKLRPIKISCGALGANVPHETLWVSQQHRFLVQSEIAMRMFDTNEILVPAGKLTDLPGVEIDLDVQAVEYFHILLEDHQIVFAHNAKTESLYLGAEAVLALTQEARQEISDLWPDIDIDTCDATPARKIPAKGKRVQHLVDRHLKNARSLQ